MNVRKAFTLIELLIVVAIIAILAAIAVPNFLEAQTRSKVSRARADLRTLATGIEAYTVDNNRPPRMWHTGFYGDPGIEGPSTAGIVFPGREVGGVMQHGLSTPIAYITNAWIIDPFVNRGDDIPFDQKVFTYQDINRYIVNNPASAYWNAAIEWYGTWRMCSHGPDRTYFNNSLISQVPLAPTIEYDPTNGTISPGNIWRSQRFSEGGQPPDDGVLLTPH